MYHTSLACVAFLMVLGLTMIKPIDGGPSFSIDYDHDTFVKDGQPFRYISGSIHYARVHPDYWQDRLNKIYAAGLNAIQVYVPWNVHEPTQGKFNFAGIANLTRFLSLANNTGLLVILRPGPYICGEWEMGGFPSWLLRLNHSIQLRTADPTYLGPVDDWMNVLLPKIKPFLYKNGGPIITVQIENEYGSYPACDHEYMRHLYQSFYAHLGDNVVFFTTDGPSEKLLKCGTLQNVYATVDFGAGGNPSGPFAVQRKFEPHGPSVNSEYYTGWLDHWGHTHQVVSKEKVANSLDDMLKLGASVNMYMFEGGTNFGFWNGANMAFNPQPTSYDYDAPLTEAGDPTDKYHVLREIIGKYNTLPSTPIPPATSKSAYGILYMQPMMSFYDALDTISPYDPIRATYPITMEDMQQSFGFMLYRTVLPDDQADPVNLSVPGIRDRGYVMINKQPVGIVERLGPSDLSITCQQNDTLDILVENMGRINYGSGINDFKGLVSNVTLNGNILQSWEIYSLDLDRLVAPQQQSSSNHKKGLQMPSTNQKEGSQKPLINPSKDSQQQQQMPTFYRGTFPIFGNPEDTYLKITTDAGWSKGQAYVNGFNLGRYWPTKGPQITLYVPAPVLQSVNNTLVLFELEYTGGGPTNAANPMMVEFIDRPIINATITSSISEDASSAWLRQHDDVDTWQPTFDDENTDCMLDFVLSNLWAIAIMCTTMPSLLWVVF